MEKMIEPFDTYYKKYLSNAIYGIVATKKSASTIVFDAVLHHTEKDVDGSTLVVHI